MNTSLVLILGLPLLCLGVVLVLIVIGASQSLLETTRKHEVWPDFAKCINGVYQQGLYGNPDHIAARIDEWPFHLDTHLVGGKQNLMNYTRMRVFYPPRMPMEAIICSSDVRDEIPQSPGMIQATGAEYGVDDDLILRTNQPEQLRKLLANPDMVSLTSAMRPFDLRIRRRRDWKEGGVSSAVYEVHLQRNGVVIDDTTLMAMYRLVEATLRRLYEMGVAGKSFAD